jgi:hypothetical protein
MDELTCAGGPLLDQVGSVAVVVKPGMPAFPDVACPCFVML